MHGILYILESTRSGRRYCGSCIDFTRRLSQHNSNAVKATRGKGPWIKVKTVRFSDERFARQAERHLKRQKRREFIDMVIADEFIWPEHLHPVI